MKRLLAFLLIISAAAGLHAQSAHSVHMEQSAAWSAMGRLGDLEYDSINQFSGRMEQAAARTSLNKRVFGYHPYWSGSSWVNYRWDLLSDLCYFSYEVDPATGNPITTHDWETAAVIDTALARGVKVHLCVTLFSGHATFFGNPQAMQNLTMNLIDKVLERGAHGINIDFEAVPSYQKQPMTDYLTSLAGALHVAAPGTELSIAAPAVNWNNTFDMQALGPVLDLVMIMAYDYYWGGSSMAGPVSGLWPMSGTFPYGVARSLTSYQAAGVKPDKILIGVPYYGREWPVTANTFPANTTGTGSAVLYRTIMAGSSGNYSPENHYWDYRSYNPYFSFFTTHWRQCFYDDVRSLGVKYDLVNRRNTAGIGIWALGYDNGRSELWNLIETKFTGTPLVKCADTLADTGGPWFNYGAVEDYTETVTASWPGPLTLSFESLSLETGYDSLWIYDGANTSAPLLLALSGNTVPPAVQTTTESFSLRFKSDNQTNFAGYILHYACPTAGMYDFEPEEYLRVFPNPATDWLCIQTLAEKPRNPVIRIFSADGRLVAGPLLPESSETFLSLSGLNPGIYLLVYSANNYSATTRLVIQ